MQGDVMCYLSESRYGWSDDDAMMKEIQKLHRWKTTEWKLREDVVGVAEDASDVGVFTGAVKN
jgi:hypothetical protein